MLLPVHPVNPHPRNFQTVINCLKNGGIVIYPTDTVYGIGCDIFQSKAVERVCRIKGLDPEKTNFSFICHDLSHLSDFTKPIDTSVYRLMKKNLPGQFTFILDANSKVPKLFKSKRKTVGIRVPDHLICLEIVKELGNPIMTTSIPMDSEEIEYTTDPELIHERFGHLVDIVIDSGIGKTELSTVVDCTAHEVNILRQGAGILND
jgi:tRNA threonylcarbamoyl adenosine modification protein (Sua5/YciO/YrdC/YwlC family)